MRIVSCECATAASPISKLFHLVSDPQGRLLTRAAQTRPYRAVTGGALWAERLAISK
jgi:hypothetical protein